VTVKSDLQKAIASSESSRGTYSLMAESTEDPQAKQMYNIMKADMDRHLQYLNDRLNYITQNNTLNQQ